VLPSSRCRWRFSLFFLLRVTYFISPPLVLVHTHCILSSIRKYASVLLLLAFNEAARCQSRGKFRLELLCFASHSSFRSQTRPHECSTSATSSSIASSSAVPPSPFHLPSTLLINDLPPSPSFLLSSLTSISKSIAQWTVMVKGTVGRSATALAACNQQ
jgi:hypothetical protein